jgi:hypothetical protein
MPASNRISEDRNRILDRGQCSYVISAANLNKLPPPVRVTVTLIRLSP